MPIRDYRAVLCLVIALAMAIGSLLPNGARSPSHDPVAFAATAVAETNAPLWAGLVEHEHSHDHGDEHERVAGHSDDHNPADHTHETLSAPPVAAAMSPVMIRNWLPVSPHAAHVGASYRLERPPKPNVIA